MKGSDNPYPSILLEDHADPAAPTNGFHRLFVDTDEKLKMIDHASLVTDFTPTSGGSTADSAQMTAATAVSNGSWVDLVTLSCADGTWIFWGQCTVLIGISAGNFNLCIKNDTVIEAETSVTCLSTGVYYACGVVSPPIVLTGGPTTIHLQARANAANMIAQDTTITADKATTLVGLKIA